MSILEDSLIENDNDEVDINEIEKKIKEIEPSEPDDALRVDLDPLVKTDKVDYNFLNVDRPSGHLTNDPILIKYQKSVIYSLVGSIGQSILKGKSLSTISLPVRIFEARSYLQRLTDQWSNIEYLLNAVNNTDPVEKLKWIATFSVSGLRYTVLQAKPFNPILGETFQATYPEGINLYMEQVTHHPAVSSWLMEDNKGSFRFYGSAEYKASFRGNTIYAHQFGPQKVTFGDGTYIEWTWPTLSMSGYIYGERRSNYWGTMTFRYPAYHLQLEIVFIFRSKGFWKSLGGWLVGKKELPGDFFKGEVCRYSSFPPSVPSFNSSSTSSSPVPTPQPSPIPTPQHTPIPCTPSPTLSSSLSPSSSSTLSSSSSSAPSSTHSPSFSTPFSPQHLVTSSTSAASSSIFSSSSSGTNNYMATTFPKPIPKNSQKTVLSHVDGTWLGCINFDKNCYWDVRHAHPVSPIPVENPLPSDCRYRKDLQHLAHKELKEAQIAKEEMENLQRYQASLRAKGRK